MSSSHIHGFFIVIALCGSMPAFAQDSTRWDLQARVTRFEEHLGRRAIFVQQGYAYLKDATMADGTIEVDVAVPKERTFAGVAFRVQPSRDREEFYLRPHKSGLEDAMQYQPVINGATTWQVFNGPGFTGAVDIPKERWFHVRIELNARGARVFLDGAPEPALVIPELHSADSAGGIGVWGGPGGAWFADLRYVPGRSRSVLPRVLPPLHAGIVQRWELSRALEAEDSLPSAVPTDLGPWERVSTEPTGVLLINHYRRSTGALPPSAVFSKRLERGSGRRIVFARTIIESRAEHVQRVHLGYSDEVVVFLNGRPLFQGRSAWRFRDETALGIVDVEGDAVYLPLRRGRNELVIAVAEYFGGWALIARLADPQRLIR